MAKLLAILFVLFLIVSSTTNYITARNVTYNCQQTEVLKARLSAQVRTSIQRLPTLAYYKDHPDELAFAIRQSKETLKSLSPSTCRGIFG